MPPPQALKGHTSLGRRVFRRATLLATFGFCSCFAASATAIILLRAETRSDQESPARLEEPAEQPLPVELSLPSSNADDERAAELITGRERGDRYLLGGNVIHALAEYSRVAAETPDSNDDALSFRRALCREALGKFDQALAEYERLVTTSRSAGMVDAAKLGKCRVYMRMRRERLAEHILWKWLIEANDATNRDSIADATYLLSHLLVHRVQKSQSTSYLDPATLAFPLADLTAAEILNRALATEAFADSSALTVESAPEPEAAVAQWELVQRFGDTPETAVFRATVAKESIRGLIERLCFDAEMEVKWSNFARDEVSRRFAALNIRDMTLALILDALLSPQGLTWRDIDGGIEIFGVDEVDESVQQRARIDVSFRLLRHLVVAHPDHPDAAVGMVALGNMALLKNDAAQAISNLQEAIRMYPRSQAAVHASFNLGKLYLQSNQRPDAERMFYQVVDDLGTYPFRSAAYIQLARIFLGDDQPERAVKAAHHGVNMADNDGDRAAAAISLASAYLLENHYHAANNVLFEHHDALLKSPYVRVGALLSAKARYDAARSKSQKENAGRALLAATLRAEPDRFLGEHGYLILARAQRKVGMLSDAEKHYILGTQQTTIGSLRHRMQFELAELYRQKRELARAQQIFATLAVRDSEIGRQSIKQLAELAYRQRQDEDCERYCLAIVTRKEHRIHALELLGRLYERQGRHQLAAECFAGKLPQSDLSRKP